MKLKRQWRREGDVIWAARPSQRVVALTFDDGPNPYYTEAILQELKQANARATFFLIGTRVRQFPDLARKIAAQGHEIGLHGYTHQNMAGWDAERITQDLQASEHLFNSLGLSARCFRPPGGGISPQLVAAAKAHRYRVILWSWTQDPRDWIEVPRASVIAQHVLKNLRPGDVILLHDSPGVRKATLEAVKAILQGLKERQFQAVTVTEMLAMAQLEADRTYPPRGPR